MAIVTQRVLGRTQVGLQGRGLKEFCQRQIVPLRLSWAKLTTSNTFSADLDPYVQHLETRWADLNKAREEYLGNRAFRAVTDELRISFSGEDKKVSPRDLNNPARTLLDRAIVPSEAVTPKDHRFSFFRRALPAITIGTGVAAFSLACSGIHGGETTDLHQIWSHYGWALGVIGVPLAWKSAQMFFNSRAKSTLETNLQAGEMWRAADILKGMVLELADFRNHLLNTTDPHLSNVVDVAAIVHEDRILRETLAQNVSERRLTFGADKFLTATQRTLFDSLHNLAAAWPATPTELAALSPGDRQARLTEIERILSSVENSITRKMTERSLLQAYTCGLRDVINSCRHQPGVLDDSLQHLYRVCGRIIDGEHLYRRPQALINLTRVAYVSNLLFAIPLGLTLAAPGHTFPGWLLNGVMVSAIGYYILDSISFLSLRNKNLREPDEEFPKLPADLSQQLKVGFIHYPYANINEIFMVTNLLTRLHHGPNVSVVADILQNDIKVFHREGAIKDVNRIGREVDIAEQTVDAAALQNAGLDRIGLGEMMLNLMRGTAEKETATRVIRAAIQQKRNGQSEMGAGALEIFSHVARRLKGRPIVWQALEETINSFRARARGCNPQELEALSVLERNLPEIVIETDLNDFLNPADFETIYNRYMQGINQLIRQDILTVIENERDGRVQMTLRRLALTVKNHLEAIGFSLAESKREISNG